MWYTSGLAIRVRTLTDDERTAIERLAHSRTAPARKVERAQIVWQAHQGGAVAVTAERLRLNPQTVRDWLKRLNPQTVRDWLKRFNAEGLAGLDDRPRSGKPPTYTPEQAGEVIAVALSDPQELGLPFACWTLDRLAAYLSEHKSIPIRRSRISEMLVAEGLRWRQQETWFGERVDPAFAEKRGASNPSTPPRPTAAS